MDWLKRTSRRVFKRRSSRTEKMNAQSKAARISDAPPQLPPVRTNDRPIDLTEKPLPPPKANPNGPSARRTSVPRPGAIPTSPKPARQGPVQEVLRAEQPPATEQPAATQAAPLLGAPRVINTKEDEGEQAQRRPSISEPSVAGQSTRSAVSEVGKDDAASTSTAAPSGSPSAEASKREAKQPLKIDPSVGATSLNKSLETRTPQSIDAASTHDSETTSLQNLEMTPSRHFTSPVIATPPTVLHEPKPVHAASLTNGTTKDADAPFDEKIVVTSETPPPLPPIKLAPGMSATSGPLEEFPEGGLGD